MLWLIALAFAALLFSAPWFLAFWAVRAALTDADPNER